MTFPFPVLDVFFSGFVDLKPLFGAFKSKNADFGPGAVSASVGQFAVAIDWLKRKERKSTEIRPKKKIDLLFALESFVLSVCQIAFSTFSEGLCPRRSLAAVVWLFVYFCRCSQRFL